jgi:hypothetical protein
MGLVQVRVLVGRTEDWEEFIPLSWPVPFSGSFVTVFMDSYLLSVNNHHVSPLFMLCVRMHLFLSRDVLCVLAPRACLH